MNYRAYSVSAHHREPLLRFILDALRECGCSVIRSSSPTEAPFRISFEAPTGERMGIIVYAFRANNKPTKNRPRDEHRFQVKYSSKEHGSEHHLYQDPYGLYTTLFVGIDPDLGFFVGADPVLHSPTKFFISVEFKDHHVADVVSQRWHSWERDTYRSASPVEVLVGGVQKEFLRYVRFERMAVGEDQGHRQLLAERIDAASVAVTGSGGGVVAVAEPVPAPPVLHALAQEFEMPERQVLDLIASARRLKMAVRGWVAEEKLVDVLKAVEGVADCKRCDEEGGPDVTLRYCGSEVLTVQCKNVLRQTSAEGLARLDLQRTRASKSDPFSRFYRVDDYDLIAACLHAVTLRWNFKYAVPRTLTTHPKSSVHLYNNVRLDGRWVADAKMALDEVCGLA